MNVEAFRKRLENADVVFVYDDGGNVYDWKLRALPALQFLGVDDVTYPTSWRQLKHSWEYHKGGRQFSFPGYEYHVLGGIDLSLACDLGAITTSYYEQETPYTIRPVIDRYTTIEGTLVVVADEHQFQPAGGARPLYQEPFVTDFKSYDRIYRAITNAYQKSGWDLPLQDTKNCFLQDMANVYGFVEGDQLTTTTELFDVLAGAPYLPLHRVFGEIFDDPDSHGSSPLETDDMVNALGGWLRRRIEWDRSKSIDIARELNRTVTSDSKTFDLSYIRRSPEVADAATAADRLDPESNRIEARYNNWLTEIPL